MAQSSVSLPPIDLTNQTSSGVMAATQAAGKAAKAFWAWSNMSGSTRSDFLSAMADKLKAGRNQLCDVAATEVGATPDWIDFNIQIAVQTLLQARDLIPCLADQVTHHDDGRISIVRRQAAGVVLGFAPWNAPVILATRAIAAPLACGNPVVLKASEHCPETHKTLVELLASTGIPEGVISVVVNDPNESFEVASALIAHPAIRRINFTGSTRVGQLIAVEAASAMKKCVLELSGKASLIVLNDADIDAAAAAAMAGSFVNQGQVCMSTERIVVVEDIADAFVDKLAEKSGRLSAADPKNGSAPLGRLIDEKAVDRVRGLIEDAVSKGAKILLGGDTSGSVIQPVILDYVTPNMRIYAEESFGPVASVIRVKNAEAAVSVANDTEYGLASAVFSRDPEQAMSIAARLETGICQINGPTIFDDPNMPFGGMKHSGYGRFGGLASLEEFTEIRWLCQHNELSANEIETMLHLGRTTT